MENVVIHSASKDLKHHRIMKKSDHHLREEAANTTYHHLCCAEWVASTGADFNNCGMPVIIRPKQKCIITGINYIKRFFYIVLLFRNFILYSLYD